MMALWQILIAQLYSILTVALDEVSGQHHACHFTPQGRTMVTI
jgi:hypothetical protein